MYFDPRVFGLAIMQANSRVIDPAESREDMKRQNQYDYLISKGEGSGIYRLTGSTSQIKGKVLWGHSVTECLLWIEGHHAPGTYSVLVRQISSLPSFVPSRDLMIWEEKANA
jgi:hypothetical protein